MARATRSRQAVALVRVRSVGAPLVTLESLARETGLHPEVILRFVRFGLLAPRAGTAAEPLFAQEDAPLLARAARLRRDSRRQLRRRGARQRTAGTDRRDGALIGEPHDASAARSAPRETCSSWQARRIVSSAACSIWRVRSALIPSSSPSSRRVRSGPQRP